VYRFIRIAKLGTDGSWLPSTLIQIQATIYLQEPSETDKRAVRDDPDLKGSDYVGEFVISYEMIFLITPAGRVREVAETRELFAGQ